MVPALVGLKGNLEMTLASRLSTAVSGNTLKGTQTHTHTQNTIMSALLMIAIAKEEIHLRNG